MSGRHSSPPQRPAGTWVLAGLFFLALGTCSDPRAHWGRAPAQSSAAAAPRLPPEAADIHFVDRELWPDQRWTLAAVRAANPVYAQLEHQLGNADPAARNAIQRDLGRLRLIGPAKRFVLVDTAAARLWMIEGGRVAGTMKVVTGKPGMDTPMMAALIRYAVLDPYWNLPPDLVRERVAEHVLGEGSAWLRNGGFEAVHRYEPIDEPVDPKTVDWLSVASGETQIGLRQRPGGGNAMGAVKFMFPNALGIYLHDTPERRLFRANERRFSSGCVRLEDAARLYAWLMGSALPPPDPARPERRVDLPAPVPVYILDLPSLGENAAPLPV